MIFGGEVEESSLPEKLSLISFILKAMVFLYIWVVLTVNVEFKLCELPNDVKCYVS